MTTELFLFLFKKAELSISDLELMTIAMCLDYIDAYIEFNSDNNKKKVRKATQEDFDNF